jgi:hypothetical protein
LPRRKTRGRGRRCAHPPPSPPSLPDDARLPPTRAAARPPSAGPPGCGAEASPLAAQVGATISRAAPAPVRLDSPHAKGRAGRHQTQALVDPRRGSRRRSPAPLARARWGRWYLAAFESSRPLGTRKPQSHTGRSEVGYCLPSTGAVRPRSAVFLGPSGMRTSVKGNDPAGTDPRGRPSARVRGRARSDPLSRRPPGRCNGDVGRPPRRGGRVRGRADARR